MLKIYATIMCLLAIGTIVVAGIAVSEPIESEAVESEVTESVEDAMDTDDCIILCNDTFTRADDRLLCHEQCHERFD